MKSINVASATPCGNGKYVFLVGVCADVFEAENLSFHGFHAVRNGNNEFFIVNPSVEKGKHSIGYLMNKYPWCVVPREDELMPSDTTIEDAINESNLKFLRRGYNAICELEDWRNPLIYRAYVRAVWDVNGGDVLDSGNAIPHEWKVMEVYNKMKLRNNVVPKEV